MIPPADLVPADERRDGYDKTLCAKCQKRRSQGANPRQVMSKTHSLEVVRAILIQRLDDRLSDLAEIALDVASDHISDIGTAESLAIQYIQRTQLALFPEEFGDSPPYQPDPSGRIDAVPVGLVPRLPTVSIYARALVAEERARGAGTLRMPNGEPVLSDDELMRMRNRREGQEARSVAAC